MTRDYATSRQRRQPARAGSSRRGREAVFSAPSFSAGAIFGAGVVLLAAWAPSVLQESISAVPDPVAPPAPAPEIVFEFDDMLAENTVAADTSAYPAAFPEDNADPAAPGSQYLVQAASLRTAAKAASLSSDLTSVGLPAQWQLVELETSGIWYRVTVGPFATRVEANRALTRLRERNLTARLIKQS